MVYTRLHTDLLHLPSTEINLNLTCIHVQFDIPLSRIDIIYALRCFEGMLVFSGILQIFQDELAARHFKEEGRGSVNCQHH